jgi:hypothetical protein
MRVQRIIQLAAIAITAAGVSMLPGKTAQASVSEGYACENEACYGGGTCEYHGGSECDLSCMPGSCVTWNCDRNPPIGCG